MPETTQLTTLELAGKIADSVWHAEWRAKARRDEVGTWERPLAEILREAVIEALHENGSWFCRLTETDQGTVSEQYPLLALSERDDG